jgi:hypothetical protein
MSTRKMRITLAYITIAALFVAYGCILSPDKGGGGGDNQDTTGFRPLTDKENVIFNLMLSYKRADINQYGDLLHDQYTWHNQLDPSTPNLEEQWTRTQDYNATHNMFMSTRGSNPDPKWNVIKLELDIKNASWSLYPDSIPGYPYPCTDCWQTTREYYITLATEGGDTYIGNDLCLFIVVPVNRGGQKIYQLWRAEDIPK